MPAPKRKGNAKIDQRGRANFKYRTCVGKQLWVKIIELI